MLGTTSTVGDLDTANRFDSGFLLFYGKFVQSVANHICDAIRTILMFSSFSLGFHAYIVPHFAKQRLPNKYGLPGNQAIFLTFLPLPLLRLSHSIKVRRVSPIRSAVPAGAAPK